VGVEGDAVDDCGDESGVGDAVVALVAAVIATPEPCLSDSPHRSFFGEERVAVVLPGAGTAALTYGTNGAGVPCAGRDTEEEDAMAIMLKIRWDIKAGQEADFKANQEALCAVMLEHPGVMTYHAEYPSPGVSEWTEIYANDDAFQAHLANEKGQNPLGAIVAACDTITCRCFGDANPASKEILAGFGTSYHDTAAQSFVVNPTANKDSLV
jgi:quinol monooxygenase YgiN